MKYSAMPYLRRNLRFGDSLSTIGIIGINSRHDLLFIYNKSSSYYSTVAIVSHTYSTLGWFKVVKGKQRKQIFEVAAIAIRRDARLPIRMLA
jgi:hypothetical protein